MSEPDAPCDRQQLYDEVWTDPVTVVAERYGLSDVGLAKICRKLSIPVPTRGYWAKVKAGKKMRRIALPALQQAPGALLPRATLAKLSPEKSEVRSVARKKVAEVRKAVTDVPVPEALADPHPLVRAAAKRLRQRDGWTDERGLRYAPGEVLHLEVTKPSLDRALLLVDTVIKRLREISVSVRVDGEKGRTVLDREGTLLEFKLTEVVERSVHEETPAEKRALRRYWDSRARWNPEIPHPRVPRFDYHPTGRLMITVGDYPSRRWRDTARTELEKRLGQVVAGILILMDELRAKEAEQRRRREAHERAEARYRYLKDRRDREVARLEQLEEDVANWERASRLRAYADAVEREALSMGEAGPELQEWLAWVRAKADWLDPRIQVSDPILDAPEPQRPGYFYP